MDRGLGQRWIALLSSLVFSKSIGGSHSLVCRNSQGRRCAGSKTGDANLFCSTYPYLSSKDKLWDHVSWSHQRVWSLWLVRRQNACSAAAYLIPGACPEQERVTPKRLSLPCSVTQRQFGDRATGCAEFLRDILGPHSCQLALRLKYGRVEEYIRDKKTCGNIRTFNLRPIKGYLRWRH